MKITERKIKKDPCLVSYIVTPNEVENFVKVLIEKDPRLSGYNPKMAINHVGCLFDDEKRKVYVGVYLKKNGDAVYKTESNIPEHIANQLEYSNRYRVNEQYAKVFSDLCLNDKLDTKIGGNYLVVRLDIFRVASVMVGSSPDDEIPTIVRVTPVVFGKERVLQLDRMTMPYYHHINGHNNKKFNKNKELEVFR